MSFEKTAAPNPDDTIVAVSSAPGAGARAIVRVSGPNARAVVTRVFTEDQPQSHVRSRRYVIPGSLRLSGVHSPLPATLYFFPGPRSYTGQDLAEVHTIGSPPLVERLVADLLNAGARPAQAGEFTLRAFLAGKKDLPQAEAVHAIIEANSKSDLETAFAQLAGGVSQPLAILREDLLNLLADIEAALDFADEDIEFVGQSETLAQLDRALAQLTALLLQLDNRAVSGRLVRVALVGLPNAGKSSLFNALASADVLVSAVPGTTRDYLVRRIELGGIPVELIDTAGWQDAGDTIEEQAQQLGREQATRADVIVWCDERGAFAEADADRLMATGAEVLRVRTKADLCDHRNTAHLPRVSESIETNTPILACSVIAPGGTDSLLAALADRIKTLVRPALAPSQSRCRHHVAACAGHLSAAREHTAGNDSPEHTAAALRAALDQLGEVTGAVYTNDLLDRIFSRFCIGK